MKTILLLIIGFAVGFVARGQLPAFDVSASTVKNVILPQTADQQSGEFITKVVYENGAFSPRTVTVRKGDYLTVTNNSDNLMWLDSTERIFTTPRGYARSEQLKVKPLETGEFRVGNKLNVEASFTVTVKE